MPEWNDFDTAFAEYGIDPPSEHPPVTPETNAIDPVFYGPGQIQDQNAVTLIDNLLGDRQEYPFEDGHQQFQVTQTVGSHVNVNHLNLGQQQGLGQAYQQHQVEQPVGYGVNTAASSFPPRVDLLDPRLQVKGAAALPQAGMTDAERPRQHGGWMWYSDQLRQIREQVRLAHVQQEGHMAVFQQQTQMTYLEQPDLPRGYPYSPLNQPVVGDEPLHSQRFLTPQVHHANRNSNDQNERHIANNSSEIRQDDQQIVGQNFQEQHDANIEDTDAHDCLHGTPAWAVPQTSDTENEVRIVEPAAKSHNEVMLRVRFDDTPNDEHRLPLSAVKVNAKKCDITRIGGHIYVALESPRNCKARAAIFHDIYANVADVTSAREGQENWGPERGVNRPDILYEYLPKGQYAYGTALRPLKPPTVFTPLCHTDGRVFVNDAGIVMKDSPHLPTLVSSEVEEWRVLTITRQDPTVRFQDFVDRMPVSRANNPNGAYVRPNTGTLQSRCARGRERMRLLAWPCKAPDRLSYGDRKIGAEMRAAGLNNNSTRDLEDLTKEQIKCHKYIGYLGKAERGGDRSLQVPQQLAELRVGLAYVLQQDYAESDQEVRDMRATIERLENSIL